MAATSLSCATSMTMQGRQWTAWPGARGLPPALRQALLWAMLGILFEIDGCMWAHHARPGPMKHVMGLRWLRVAACHKASGQLMLCCSPALSCGNPGSATCTTQHRVLTCSGSGNAGGASSAVVPAPCEGRGPMGAPFTALGCARSSRELPARPRLVPRPRPLPLWKTWYSSPAAKAQVD